MMFLGSEQYLIENMPFPTDQWAVRAFVDGWSPFLFEMFGIATFALWASRKPAKYASAALLLVWLEFTHGVLDDLFLIARGYDAGGYIAFYRHSPCSSLPPGYGLCGGGGGTAVSPQLAAGD
ncbi:MAG: hypothetical protein IPG51_20740 [Chloroflexi bacterium]|nr:hypothetical protein [Chloroflexota bacterium]